MERLSGGRKPVAPNGSISATKALRDVGDVDLRNAAPVRMRCVSDGSPREHGATIHGHEVELEFDKKLMVVNRPPLRVDGDVVDGANIVYGDVAVIATLDDGVQIEVKFDSWLGGELRHAQGRSGEGHLGRPGGVRS